MEDILCRLCGIDYVEHRLELCDFCLSEIVLEAHKFLEANFGFSDFDNSVAITDYLISNIGWEGCFHVAPQLVLRIIFEKVIEGN